jgi:hypothetical protein
MVELYVGVVEANIDSRRRLGDPSDRNEAAEMDRPQLVCNRRQMKKDEYLRALNAAWLRSVDALEIPTALRTPKAVTDLREATEYLDIRRSDRQPSTIVSWASFTPSQCPQGR